MVELEENNPQAIEKKMSFFTAAAFSKIRVCLHYSGDHSKEEPVVDRWRR